MLFRVIEMANTRGKIGGCQILCEIWGNFSPKIP